MYSALSPRATGSSAVSEELSTIVIRSTDGDLCRHSNALRKSAASVLWTTMEAETVIIRQPYFFGLDRIAEYLAGSSRISRALSRTESEGRVRATRSASLK